MITNMSSRSQFWDSFRLKKEKKANKWESQTENIEESIIINFVLSIISSVEIRYKSGTQSDFEENLRRFYFQIPPSCFLFTNFAKNALLDKTPIDSTSAKQLYLYEQALDIEPQLNLRLLSYQKIGFIENLSTPLAFYCYKIFVQFLCITLNAMMFVYLEDAKHTTVWKIKNIQGKTFIIVFSILIITCSFLLIILWLVFYATNFKKNRTEKFKNNQASKWSKLVFLKNTILGITIKNSETNSF